MCLPHTNDKASPGSLVHGIQAGLRAIPFPGGSSQYWQADEPRPGAAGRKGSHANYKPCFIRTGWSCGLTQCLESGDRPGQVSSFQLAVCTSRMRQGPSTGPTSLGPLPSAASAEAASQPHQQGPWAGGRMGLSSQPPGLRQ